MSTVPEGAGVDAGAATGVAFADAVVAPAACTGAGTTRFTTVVALVDTDADVDGAGDVAADTDAGAGGASKLGAGAVTEGVPGAVGALAVAAPSAVTFGELRLNHAAAPMTATTSAATPKCVGRSVRPPGCSDRRRWTSETAAPSVVGALSVGAS